MNRITATPSLFLLPALLMALFLGVSFYCLNFGVHWDETAAKFDSVRDTVKTGIFLQGSGGEVDGFHYNYGGMNYILTWAGFTPELWHFVRHGQMTRVGLAAAIGPKIYGMKVRLRVRAIYLVLCSLSILWLFLLNIVLGRSRLEAFLAAAILAASWEVQYHSRWIAPDEVMMQFVLLSFLLLTVGWATKKSTWLFLGAVTAGLAMGTKYNAAILLPPFLCGAAVVVWQQTGSLAAVVKRGIAFTGTSLLAFVLTSPGIVIDPFHFFFQLQLQRSIYAAGWFGHTVRPGIPYISATLRYFALQLFSAYQVWSILLFAFCLIGFVCLIVHKPRLPGLVMTGFVVLYLAYFSQQSALIVRNLLVVVPVLCLAAARGIIFTSEIARVKLPKVKYAIHVCIAIALTMNLGWEVYAADQTKRRLDLDYFVEKFESYARNKPGDTFLISSKLSRVMQSVSSAPVPGNIVTDASMPFTKVAFLQSEGPDLAKFWPEWPANRVSLYETTFGALEVNLHVYPTFIGNQRILLVTAERFRKLPIKLADLGY